MELSKSLMAIVDLLDLVTSMTKMFLVLYADESNVLCSHDTR
jgi:hypothetical protein